MESILRRELKTWQKAFKTKHGRDPTKRDILADPKIAGTYDTWQAVGGDVKAKSRPSSYSVGSSSCSATASTSSQRLGESSQAQEVFKTPSKKRSQKFTDATVPTCSPSRNPFRTPTKSSPHLNTPLQRRNPFATPSRRSEPPTQMEVSPARSLIEVEMTPTKRSPLVDKFARRDSQYVTASPSKLRSALAAGSRLTPTKMSPHRGWARKETDVALNQALVAYTPRTKARKRLRGEEVPPTPNTRKDLAGVARTDPRPAAQRGLSAFGFASSRKVGENRSVTAPANVFSRAISTGHAPTRRSEEDQDGDDEMLGESPIKAVAKLRRATSAKPGFKPLFVSPNGNHTPRDVLGTGAVSNGIDRPKRRGAAVQGVDAVAVKDADANADADAVMDDGSSSPVGGLFAAEVQQRRLRRARETEGSTVEEFGVKKHKARVLDLPASSDDERAGGLGSANNSSPAYRNRDHQAMMSSSPQTDLTIPSSAARPTSASQSKGNTNMASPGRGGGDGSKANPVPLSRVAGWRRVQQVELSDEDEVPLASAGGGGAGEKQGVKPRKKVISITPYQRYGTLRTSVLSEHINAEEEDDEEESEFSPYTLLHSTQRAAPAIELNAVQPISTESDDDQDPHTSLAGLKLSPVRHMPSSKANKITRLRLLNSIFDPTTTTHSTKAKSTSNVFNPEARFGPLQPSNSTTTINHDDDDDEDWQQEVDQDFTFLDSEIELQDVA